MPHQCVRCGNFLEDGAKELLEGCSCGSKFFFFMSQKALDKVKNASSKFPDPTYQIDDGVYIINYKVFINDQPTGLPLNHVSTLENSFSFSAILSSTLYICSFSNPLA